VPFCSFACAHKLFPAARSKNGRKMRVNFVDIRPPSANCVILGRETLEVKFSHSFIV